MSTPVPLSQNTLVVYQLEPKRTNEGNWPGLIPEWVIVEIHIQLGMEFAAQIPTQHLYATRADAESALRAQVRNGARSVSGSLIGPLNMAALTMGVISQPELDLRQALQNYLAQTEGKAL